MSSIKDLEVLATAMAVVGFRLIHSEPGNMDSGVAQFSNGTRTVSVFKDRSQWMFKEPRQKLEPLGYFKAFNDTLEFRGALLDYVKRQV